MDWTNGCRGRNRLASEKSPYLLQHANNPVDWYPWCEEAFEKARRENKPIFLSVGYSTCHWCHVMERESFSDDSIGRLMNKYYISIKVDREERPDVDRVYMTFLQATNGDGGWPMSVFLTPSLHPFLAGTFFPAKDSNGQPMFESVLNEVAKQWEAQSDALQQQGMTIIDILRKDAEGAGQTPSTSLPSLTCTGKGFRQLVGRYDTEYGGFSESPKFPQPAAFNFLLRFYSLNRANSDGQKALEMTLFTLRKMADGGIHDHIGNGFHRYSTDRFWHIPHFEKMLYDQAQLCISYLEAYQASKDPFFADVARDILMYIGRDLSDPEGGFYSAEDADSFPTIGASHKREGAFCVWTHEEIRNLLPQVVEGSCQLGECVSFSQVFCRHYGVTETNKIQVAGDLSGQNVLRVHQTVARTAESFGISVEHCERVLSFCRQQLLEARRLRPRAQRDDKIVTAWNGLAMSAFARAGQVLGDDDYLQRAIEGARFIEVNLYNPVTGRLLRNCYRDTEGSRGLGISHIEGFSTDYAYLIRGLLDLFEGTFDDHWLEWAVSLQDKQDGLFLDRTRGGYFDSTAEDRTILFRTKDDQDGAEPTACSVAASNLLRLAEYTQNNSYKEGALAIFRTFAERLEKYPQALPEMLSAYIFHHSPLVKVLAIGCRDTSNWSGLVNAVHGLYLPHKLLGHISSPDCYLAQRMHQLQTLIQPAGHAQLLIHKDSTWLAPTSDTAEVNRILALF